MIHGPKHEILTGIPAWEFTPGTLPIHSHP